MANYWMIKSDVVLDLDIDNLISNKNMEDVRDMIFAISKTFTETEKKIMDIFSSIEDAITANKIRSYFTEAFVFTICDEYIKRFKKLGSNTREQMLLLDAATFHIEGHSQPILNYPSSLNTSFAQIQQIMAQLFPVGKDRKDVEKIVKKSKEETESQRFIRWRKVLSDFGLNVPSQDLIQASLEHLENMGLVVRRDIKDNKKRIIKSIWCYSPKFSILERRVNRLEAKNEV